MCWIMHLQVITAVCGLMLWFIGASTKKKGKHLEQEFWGLFFLNKLDLCMFYWDPPSLTLSGKRIC